MKQKEQYNWERLHCLLEDAAARIAVSGLVKCKMPSPQPPLGRHSNCYKGCGQQLTGDWVAEGNESEGKEATSVDWKSHLTPLNCA